MIKFKEKRKIFRKLLKNIVVLYHNDCTDGFSAAWVAWKKFGDSAEYIGINPGSQPLDGLINKEIYMLDVIYPLQYLDGLVKKNKKIIIIDHHFTNQEAFKLVSSGLFDIKHSGAVLSWQYFFPQKSTPKLLKYVEDMDLWKFKLAKTKEVISYLDMVEFNFKKWDQVSKGLGDKIKYKKYIESGSLILKYQDFIIDRIIANHAVKVNFLGYKSYAVNSPLFNSQIGNILYTHLPPLGIVWAQENDGSIHVSLRSDGTVDVSRLAAKFNNGGGHKQSAGFRVGNFADLPWKSIKS